MDDMNDEMKQANKHITGMEKWCGLFVCPWNRGGSKVRDADATWKAPKEKKQKQGAARNEPTNQTQAHSGPIVQVITNDDREKEMEENMQGVSSILSTLKTQASEMNKEIGKQNSQLDRVTHKVLKFALFSS